MTDPRIAQKSPFGVQVEAGKNYFWCACGQSRNQPFCDGSHKGSGFTPLPYKSDATKQVWFCGCKHSKSRPLCDGTHSRI